MIDEKNREIWSRHYTAEKSRQTIPDENIVRFYQRFLRSYPQIREPFILEVGSGSGRNLSYLQQLNSNAYGMDFASNVLLNQKNVVCALSSEIPFSDNSFDIVIAWGLLHYLSHENVKKTLEDIRRVLKKSGVFWGTIRSNQDTHLNSVFATGDLRDGSANFYSKEDVLKLFENFNEIKLGFIMRQNPGDEKIIAHHTFELRP